MAMHWPGRERGSSRATAGPQRAVIAEVLAGRVWPRRARQRRPERAAWRRAPRRGCRRGPSRTPTRAMRSRSRSTTSRVATLWPQPTVVPAFWRAALASGPYHAMRSRRRRASGPTRRRSMSRVLHRFADRRGVISKTIRLTGIDAAGLYLEQVPRDGLALASSSVASGARRLFINRLRSQMVALVGAHDVEGLEMLSTSMPRISHSLVGSGTSAARAGRCGCGRPTPRPRRRRQRPGRRGSAGSSWPCRRLDDDEGGHCGQVESTNAVLSTQVALLLARTPQSASSEPPSVSTPGRR